MTLSNQNLVQQSTPPQNTNSVDIRPALAAMDAHPEVRYVGLRTAKTRHVTRETVTKVCVRCCCCCCFCMDGWMDRWMCGWMR